MPKSANIIAIVPAAGTGNRMQLDIPKQYLTINGKTILEYSVAHLLAHPKIAKVIIALNTHDNYFRKLPIAHHERICFVEGGAQRSDSVMAALNRIDDESIDWVLIHDAARPCLRLADLERIIAITQEGGVGGILVTPVRDTMKRSVPGESRIAYTVDRDNLWHALTPQLFPIALLRECLNKAQERDASITDDASALEFCGYQPKLILGHSDNIKVTRQEDLALAEFYLGRL